MDDSGSDDSTDDSTQNASGTAADALENDHQGSSLVTDRLTGTITTVDPSTGIKTTTNYNDLAAADSSDAEDDNGQTNGVAPDSGSETMVWNDQITTVQTNSDGSPAGSPTTNDDAGSDTQSWANGATTDQGASVVPQSSASSPIPSVGNVATAADTNGQGDTTGGNVVVITGTGFTSDAQVSFDGVPAQSSIVKSPTEIIAVSPAHAAGAVHVRVTNAAGASAISSADEFNYDPPPSGNGGTTSGGNPPVTTGGTGDNLTTGLIVPDLDPSKIQDFLMILQLADDTQLSIARVKEQLADAQASAKGAWFASSRREAAAKVIELEQALQMLKTDMASCTHAFTSGGFDDILAIGFPQGLTDDLARGVGAGGVGFEAALLAYQTARTRMPAIGPQPTEGPIEFVVTSFGPGLVIKGIRGVASKAAGEFVLAGVGGATRSILTKGLAGFKRAKEFGILPYNQLANLTAGKGLRAHHLIEKRFADVLGVNANKMLSIALTPAEHQVFTNLWRNAIGHIGDLNPVTTANATKQQIMEAARDIYRNYPAILRALGL